MMPYVQHFGQLLLFLNVYVVKFDLTVFRKSQKYNKSIQNRIQYIINVTQSMKQDSSLVLYSFMHHI